MILIINFFVSKPNYQAIVHFIDCRWRFTCNYMESTWKLHVKFYMEKTWEIQEQKSVLAMKQVSVYFPWKVPRVIPMNSHVIPWNMGITWVYMGFSREIPVLCPLGYSTLVAPRPGVSMGSKIKRKMFNKIHEKLSKSMSMVWLFMNMVVGHQNYVNLNIFQ